MNRIKDRLGSDQGFAVVEAVVEAVFALVILGIIAAIAVPAYLTLA